MQLTNSASAPRGADSDELLRAPTTRRPFLPSGGIVIVALHLPPLPGAPQNTMTVDAIARFAVDNAQMFASHGVDALYLQDPGHGVGPKRTPPEIVAALAVVAHAVRRSVPIPVGLLTAGYDAEGPLVAAAAAGADFVRLKVYLGTMAKPEGIVEGCAHEALATRQRLGIQHIRILADIYDRVGVPVAPEDLESVAVRAASRGGADALILTGRRVEETVEMLDRVRRHGSRVPLLCGGGATAENVGALLSHCDGVIVSTSLRARAPDPLWSWDPTRVGAFMAAARAARERPAP